MPERDEIDAAGPKPLSRREFARTVGLVAGGLALGACVQSGRTPEPSGPAPELVNDVHSQLNATRVAQVLRPASEDEVVSIVRSASRRGTPMALCGGRHAGGGQQFLRDQALIDLRGLNSSSRFDPRLGLITIGAGAFWPEVMGAIDAANAEHGTRWAIHQKQGGSDWLTIGGAVSANAHGRCLDSAPMVQDVESLRVVLPDGLARTISRDQEPDLFALIVGGYGLWGIVSEVTLRLVPRCKLGLTVERCAADAVIPAFDDHRRAGAVHGDWAFSIDPATRAFLNEGVLSSYAPAPEDAPVADAGPSLDSEALVRLALLAHADPGRAFDLFAGSCEERAGRVDWSDRWQTSAYVPGYHGAVDTQLGAKAPGTEVLSEFYVPPARLPEFLERVSAWLRESGARLVYGVVRFIRRDGETFLNWAREDQACVIFNLHVDHTDAGIDAVHRQLRGIARIALELDGRFYLTYGRFADREQLLRAYPMLPRFLDAKRRNDPRGLFQSDWYLWVVATLG